MITNPLSVSVRPYGIPITSIIPRWVRVGRLSEGLGEVLQCYHVYYSVYWVLGLMFGGCGMVEFLCVMGVYSKRACIFYICTLAHLLAHAHSVNIKKETEILNMSTRKYTRINNPTYTPKDRNQIQELGCPAHLEYIYSWKMVQLIPKRH